MRSSTIVRTLMVALALGGFAAGCGDDDGSGGSSSGGAAGSSSAGTGGTASGGTASGGTASGGTASGGTASGGTAGSSTGGAAGGGSGGTGGTAAAGGAAGSGGSAGSNPCTSPLDTVSVWLIGDSTVASGSGWGDFLGDYLAPEANVKNRARGGRSSKSFYEESNSAWSSSNSDAVMNGIQPGDFVVIQFGHNDSKPEEYRRTEPGSAPDYQGTYRDYLELYINETKAEGATPILVTSVSRMVFGTDGTLARTHGEYPPAARKVAQDNNVALIDLEEESFQVFNALGKTETLKLYAEDGGADLTHFPPEKAFRVTEIFTGLLTPTKTTLACYLKP